MSPELLSPIVFVVVGLAAGWIGEKTLSRPGMLKNLLLGVGGAVAAGYLAKLLNIDPFGIAWLRDVVAAVIGAYALLIGVRAPTGPF